MYYHGDEAVTCPACYENYPSGDYLTLDPVTDDEVCHDCVGQWHNCNQCQGVYRIEDLFECGGCNDCLHPPAVLQLTFRLKESA